MHKKALLALMLAVAMLMSGCALIEKDEAVDRATEIIKVGDHVHTKGEILDMVDNQLAYLAQMYSWYGMSYDVTDAQNIADATDSVIDYLVENDVKNMKAAELGLDVLTDEEQETLDANTEESWQSIRDQVKSYYFADTELEGDELEAAIDARCEEQGISREDSEEQERQTLVQEKLRQETIKDVTVSEEELQAALDEKAESAKTTYESSPSSYGTSVNNGSTVYYRPAGYRMVKQILVKFLEEDQTVIDDLTARQSTASSTVTSLTTQLTSLGVEDPDALADQVQVTLEEPAAPVFVEEAAAADLASATDLATDTDLDAVPASVVNLATVTDISASFTDEVSEEVAQAAKDLAVAKAELAFYTEQLTAAKAEAFAHIDAKADDILAQLAAGADWDALMAETTEDPGMQGDSATAKNGYAVCENMTGMDTAFTTAAMALEKVGDVSPKTEGIYGYYIIQYTADVAEGPVALDDVRETLSSSTLSTKQTTVYNEAVEQWVTDADAKIDRKALEQ